MTDTKPGRPISVTLLILGVLSIAGINIIRLIQVLESWDLLKAWLPFSPAFLASTSLIIAAAGIFIAISLLLCRTWALTLTRFGVVAYLLYYWINKLLLEDSATSRTNWFFQVVITLIVLIFTIWITSSATVKKYFGD